MRYSAVQEDGYGISLKQNNIHPNNNNNSNNVDDSIMAATGEIQPVGENTENCSMIYNLPLLFANGYPTSLEKITLSQLEKFITFMVKCSTDPSAEMKKPIWWPDEVKFSIPVIRPPNGQGKWFENLKKLVYRCYNYHRSEYLLRFCSCLALYPPEKLRYVNNFNFTTNLYHKSTGKLLATFRNENMNYDKVNESPRKSLLALNNGNFSLSNKYKNSPQKKHKQTSSSLVVIQPQTEEIYLCETCDAEFETLDQMKDHERTCGELKPTSSISRSTTPCEIESEVELNENQFLEYFHLIAANQLAKRSSPPVTDIINIETETTRTTRKIRPSLILTRHPTIPFSSPAGLAMVKKAKGMTDVVQQERLDRIERYLSAPPLTKTHPKWFNKTPQHSRWHVTYKPNKENLGKDHYVHQYTFGAVKRKPILSLRSQLLYITCRPIYVRLEKLTDEEIEDLKNHPWKYKCPSPDLYLKHHSRIVMRIGRKIVGGSKRKYYSNVQVIPAKKGKNSKAGVNNNNNYYNNNSLLASDQSIVRTPVIQKTVEQKKILLVNLCSSDEEDGGTDSRISSDENRDPLNKFESSSRTACLKNLALQPTKCLSNGLDFSNDSMHERLRDSILTDDNDKSSNNKRLMNSVIDSYKNFSPIFKPAP
ncbi:uncharacterized protein ova [Chelonus insularis]|uniref:uncharacterized protein ova n=1 Tax=Chelonus insularis TaxID=460826 RepID=UPI00158F6667|nr:uncharacterized protein LOC118068676 [Chelonus insularis]XP_034942161.1 uncharacterized protein LOC118068676 [Chelonus insularis]